MDSGKYGRLFAEQDVKVLLRFAYEEGRQRIVHQQDASGIPLDPADSILAKYEALRAEGVPWQALTFPADEPLFVLRASEGGTVEVLHDAIVELISRPIRGVLEVPLTQAAAVFREWQAANPDRVKVID
jgi:hypothetical protein